MRILIVGTTYAPALNGQAVFTTNLAEGLARRGHAVCVAYPSEKGQPFQTERNGVRLEAQASLSLRFLHEEGRFSPVRMGEVRRILTEFQPEVVHIHDHYPLSRAFALEARRRKIRLIGTNHFMPENLVAYVPFNRALRPLYRWLGWRWALEVYNRLDVVVTQSAAAGRLLKAAGLRPPVESISCGIDTARFHPDSSVNRAALRQRFGLHPTQPLFLFVGRVDSEKRLDVLIRAFHRLKRADVQLLIAGKGGVLEEMRALARALGLSGQIHFPGFVANEDLPGLLNSADIFVMPGEAELLSIASLEAMACARPMLLADAVALPELVTPGVNGRLFRSGDAADAARQMAALLDERDSWPAMGQASLERAQKHSLENVLQSYENLYQREQRWPPTSSSSAVIM